MSSSIPSWQILTAHAQPFRAARDLAFCLKVPLDSLLVWTSSEGSGETARMRRLAWTFAARIGDKYQIRLTRSIWSMCRLFVSFGIIHFIFNNSKHIFTNSYVLSYKFLCFIIADQWLIVNYLFEPPHHKTNKMTFAPSEDSDKPGHLPSLIRVFAVNMKKHWVLSYPFSTLQRLIRLGGCPGWSSSSLGALIILLVLSCRV